MSPSQHNALLPAVLVLALVLAQATAAEPPLSKPAEVERLVKQLGSPTFEEREAASKALEKIGERPLPTLDRTLLILEQAARSPDAEVRKRAKALAAFLLGRARTRAVAHVKQLGGWVWSDPPSPDREVLAVVLDDTRVGDADVAVLRWLSEVQAVSLARTAVTNDGLAHLQGLDRLYELRLSGTRVTDAGLARLRHLEKLRCLDVSGTGVTDAGLDHLKDLGNLSYLILKRTKVTKKGIAHLQQHLPKVEVQR